MASSRRDGTRSVAIGRRARLRTRCASLAGGAARASGQAVSGRAFGAWRARDAARGEHGARRTWRSRLVPLALAATLVLIVGGAFVYQLTAASTNVMAAELTADHMKCFAMNARARYAADARDRRERDGVRVRLADAAAASRWRRAGARRVAAMSVRGRARRALMYRHNGRRCRCSCCRTARGPRCSCRCSATGGNLVRRRIARSCSSPARPREVER